jgi:hypothetical protein
MNHSIPTSQGSQQGSLLLQLPPEVQVKIYAFASKHTGAIKPRQWLPGSSKFGCDCEYATPGFRFSRPRYTNGRLPEALTAVHLSATCRFICNIVIGDLLFYKVNNFEFESTRGLLAYLIAILPCRRNAIQNISAS